MNTRDANIPIHKLVNIYNSCSTQDDKDKIIMNIFKECKNEGWDLIERIDFLNWVRNQDEVIR